MSKILIIEPFYSGSHKQLIDYITKILDYNEYELVTMPGKKWPWRARCSALYLAQTLPDTSTFHTVFCSSVLNLAELIGLRPEIAKLKKIVYFHENELIYPKQEIKARDCQYGYNQITTCMAADILVFNSEFNKSSFLGNIDGFLKIIPDHRPKNLKNLIEPKSIVIYFPLDFEYLNILIASGKYVRQEKKILHIVWPHRWEFDKNPDLLFRTLFTLVDQNIPFEVSIIGETFEEKPEIFNKAVSKLGSRLKHFGFIESKEEYLGVLIDSDVVLSTADHEFFGVSIAEAVKCGCLPILPNKLVYPELYPQECLYKNEKDLLKTLKAYCVHPNIVIKKKKDLNLDADKYTCDKLKHVYLSLLRSNIQTNQ